MADPMASQNPPSSLLSHLTLYFGSWQTTCPASRPDDDHGSSSPSPLPSSSFWHWRLVLDWVLDSGTATRNGITNSNGSQTTPTSALPVLTPQTSEKFVVGSIVGQSPQDRRYNFTIPLASGAPDGVNKTMLVVNGVSLCRNDSSALHRPPTYTRTLENLLIYSYY